MVIVDDSRTMQLLLETAFSRRDDFSLVGIAGDARAGADMIRLLKPDIATIDLHMPYIDGAGLLAMVGMPPDTCTIIVSDHSVQNVSMTAKLQGLGATACLGKRELHENPNAFFDKVNAAFDAFQTARKHSASGTGRVPSRQPTVIAGRALAARGFPVPHDEARRLDILSRERLANAVRERQFDLVTRHLAAVTGFPVCLLTFIDRDTQWIKSREGLDMGSVPREQAFCNYTICQDGAFVVANAAEDSRFADNPLVTDIPYIRSYAGYPVTSGDGTRVGALCLIDVKPRIVSHAILRQLAGMAAIVSEMIAQRQPVTA